MVEVADRPGPAEAQLHGRCAYDALASWWVWAQHMAHALARSWRRAPLSSLGAVSHCDAGVDESAGSYVQPGSDALPPFGQIAPPFGPSLISSHALPFLLVLRLRQPHGVSDVPARGSGHRPMVVGLHARDLLASQPVVCEAMALATARHRVLAKGRVPTKGRALAKGRVLAKG